MGPGAKWPKNDSNKKKNSSFGMMVGGGARIIFKLVTRRSGKLKDTGRKEAKRTQRDRNFLRSGENQRKVFDGKRACENKLESGGRGNGEYWDSEKKSELTELPKTHLFKGKRGRQFSTS